MRAKRTWTVLALAATLTANGLTVAAQDKDKEQKKVVRDVVVQSDVIVTTPQDAHGAAMHFKHDALGEGDNFVFVSTEMSIDGKVVKGAPYSAQAVTEMTHALADGNRIVRRNTANVYRDSEGRTRRDQTIGVIGPFAAAGDPPQTFFIHDPVAGVNYVLDPRSKTARKLPAPPVMFERSIAPAGDAKGVGTGVGVGVGRGAIVRREQQARAHADAAAAPRRARAASGYVFSAPAPPPPMGGPDVMVYTHDVGDEPKVEQLGKQTVEGVEAEGTRVTMTIPAGAIGNERPIEIVTERWYSPELQTVVMTRHSDPRFGENVYRLTNISRTEPARSLFEVPSDYTVKDRTNFRFLRSKKPGAEAQPEN